MKTGEKQIQFGLARASTVAAPALLDGMFMTDLQKTTPH
jgi:hypothetical protein